MGIATLVNTIISLLIYFVGIGLTSLVAKAFGKNFLDYKSEANSYWSELKLSNENIQSYYRQF